ncbi:MAG: hypothetical protein F6K47_34360 [Symploca sp. SIO2E6]|nr:hypothetical protein [Symploca sp. SIO2E6]
MKPNTVYTGWSDTANLVVRASRSLEVKCEQDACTYFKGFWVLCDRVCTNCQIYRYHRARIRKCDRIHT